MSSPELEPRHQELLLGLARSTIESGLGADRKRPAERTDGYPTALRQPRATFVTLHRLGALRGCIGTLEAYRPLVVDVVQNAWSAAFEDPRFAPLSPAEFFDLDISVSVLSELEPLRFDDEADLIRQLRRGEDGLVLQAGRKRGTFLPAVWQSLPDADQFLRNLKLKAGLPGDYWSDQVSASRYTVQIFGGE